MIHLPPSWKRSIEQVLGQYLPDRQVVLFGSRAGGTPKPHSDIDLCVMGEEPVSSQTMSEVRAAFSFSDIPVRVDVVDFATASPEFQKIILQHHEVIQSPLDPDDISTSR